MQPHKNSREVDDWDEDYFVINVYFITMPDADVNISPICSNFWYCLPTVNWGCKQANVADKNSKLTTIAMVEACGNNK